MPRCSGSKPDGAPCERIVGASQEYCYSHDPTRAQERTRAASKAARSKPNRELIRLQGRLEELAEGVLSGTTDRSDAAVAGQLLNYALRAISVGLKAREQLELIERLEHLEAVMEANRRDRYA